MRWCTGGSSAVQPYHSQKAEEPKTTHLYSSQLNSDLPEREGESIVQQATCDPGQSCVSDLCLTLSDWAAVLC